MESIFGLELFALGFYNPHSSVVQIAGDLLRRFIDRAGTEG